MFIVRIIVFVLILSSCGISSDIAERSPASDLSSSIEIGGRALTESEMASAVRICYAFRTKRNNFNTVSMGNSFEFSLTRKLCKDTEATAPISVSTTLQSQGGNRLLYNTDYSGEFNRSVETDAQGYLAPLCEQVIKGNTPINYYEQNNESIEVKFTNIGDQDRYTVRVGQRASINDPTIVVYKVLEFDVVTRNETLGASLLGIVSRSARYLSCNEAMVYDTLTQTYSH